MEQPATAKKRGRTATKVDAVRTWTDDETMLLNEIWCQHENLYNTKHKSYFNRDARQRTLTLIEEKLKENGIIAMIKQISKKLTKLKNYYGVQRKMTENSKASGAGTDDVFVSSWKFFEYLHFLSDVFTPRRTQSNTEVNESNSIYEIDNPPSAKSSKKINNAQTEGLHKIISSATTALERIASKPTQRPNNAEDDAFGNLIKAQLSQTLECDAKDDLKIGLQQMVLRCKLQVLAQNAVNLQRQN